MNLGKDVFHALAVIVWADGKVDPSESTALLGAAEACGLSPKDLEDLKHVLEHRGALEDVKTLHLGAEERAFVYAIAVWLTRVDGFVSSEEVVALSNLGDALELDAEARARADVASFAIASFAQNPDGAAHGITRLVSEIRRFACEDTVEAT